MVMADDPGVSVRARLDELALNEPHEHVWLLVFSVPAVKVTVAVVPVENPSCKIHEPPAPLNVTLPNVLLAEVICSCVPDVLARTIPEVLADPSVSVIPATSVSTAEPATVVDVPSVSVEAELIVRVLV